MKSNWKQWVDNWMGEHGYSLPSQAYDKLIKIGNKKPVAWMYEVTLTSGNRQSPHKEWRVTLLKQQTEAYEKVIPLYK